MGGGSRSRSPRQKKPDSAQRSREREARRRRAQQEYLKKYGKKSANDATMFWDGFQWMPKVQGIHSTEAQMMLQNRRARRLYLGNLPFSSGITEEALTAEMNRVMRERSLVEQQEGDPVIHMWFARDRSGNYGFVEFRSQAECERALLLDGMPLGGAGIQVRRPADFPMSPMPDILPMPGQPSPQPGQQMALIQQAMAALPAPIPQVDSVVVRLAQIIVPDAETTDEDYTEVCDDMKQGCGAHGAIESIFIVRPEHKAALPDCNTADVFIVYTDKVGAGTCIGKMTGRKYDGKTIQIESYPEDTFNATVKHLLA